MLRGREQYSPTRNARLRPALRPPPRRAQLRLPRRVLARAMARRGWPPRPLRRTPSFFANLNVF